MPKESEEKSVTEAVSESELKKEWDKKHHALHEFLSGMGNSEKDRPIKQIVQAIDESMEAYEKIQNTRKDRDRSYGKLIRATNAAMKSAELSGKLWDGKQKIDDPKNKKELEVLLAEQKNLSDELDYVMLNEMPPRVHEPMMKKSKTAFKEIGFEQADHVEHYKKEQPGAHSSEYSGNYNLDNKNYRDARDDFNRALEYEPNNSQALSGRAAAQYNLGQFQAANSDARSALQINPNDAAAFSIYKLTQGRAGLSSSGDAGQPAAAHAPAAQGAASVAAGSSSDKAFMGVSAMPAGVAASSQFGREAQMALQMGDYKGAVAQASRAIGLNPKNAQAYNFRAMAHNGERSYEQGLKDAIAGLQLAPASGPLLNSKAYAQNRMEDYQGALETSNYALELNPGDAVAHANRAYALGGLGDRLGMLEELKKAASLDRRFQYSLESALQLPADGDVLFLFPGEERKGTPALPAKNSRKRMKNFGMVGLMSLIGGLLMAAGFLRRGGSSKKSARSRTASSDVSETLRGQYKIVRRIGSGGMGQVFEGFDKSLERRVAIKKMLPEINVDKRGRERFVTEAKTVASLHHPHIVDIYAIMEDDADIYLVFEYIGGKTVGELIAEGGALGFPETLRIARAIASALDFAHGRGIIHRDLKPSNVMIDEEGRIKVMDFGIARLAKDALNQFSMTNTVMGTPPYMAPEQEQGTVCKQSDVYSLAIFFYEMLTGRLPFAGTGMGMLMNKINKSYTPISELVPGVPVEIDEIFAAAFAVEPEKRISSPREFITALELLPIPGNRV